MNAKKQINIIASLIALNGASLMLFGFFSGMETIARNYNNILYSAVIPLIFGFALIEISKNLKEYKKSARISIIIISAIEIIIAPIWILQGMNIAIALIEIALSIWFLIILFNKKIVKLYK